MSRRAHRHHDARPWETHAPDDERARPDQTVMSRSAENISRVDSTPD